MSLEEQYLQNRIDTLETELSNLKDEYNSLSPLFHQSLMGMCVMNFDKEGIKWDQTTDKDTALDYVFDHLKLSKVNQAMLDQYLANEEDFIGLTPRDFFSLDINDGREVAKKVFDAGNYRIKTREAKSDGTPMYVDAYYICLYDNKGRIDGLFCAQQETKENVIFERTFETLYENAPIPYQSLDKDGNFIRVNKKWCEETGFSEEEVLGKPFKSILSPEFQKVHLGFFNRLIKEGEIKNLNLDIVTKSGNVINTLYEASTSVDSDSNFLFTNCVFQNITNQLETEKKRKQNENNFKNLFNTIEGLLFILNLKGEIIDVNKAVINRLGYSKEELIGQSVLAVHPKDRREEAAQIVQEMLEGKKDHCPVPIQSKDNKLIPVETYVSLGEWYGEKALIGFSKDISALKSSEEKFSKAFELNPGISGISDLETGKYIEVNPMFYKTFKLNEEDVIGHKATDIIKMDDAFREKAISELKNKGYIRNIETTLESKNGIKINALMSADIIEINGKKYNYTTALDITKTKENEAAILQAKELAEAKENDFRQLFDNMTQGFAVHQMVYDEKGKSIDYIFLSINKAFEKLTGLKRSSSIGKSILTLLPETEEYWINTYAEVAQTGKAIEFENYAKEIDKHFSVIAYSPQKGFFATIFTDVTQKKKDEIALKKAKEKAEVANIYKNQFLANMSHEIRTPMNGIIGFANLLRKDNISPEKRDQYLDIIDSNSKQLLNLITDIIDIAKIEARELKVDIKECQLSKLLKETEETFWSIKTNHKKQILITANYPSSDEGLVINTDENRLKQILFNLIGNAYKFTENGEIVFGFEIIKEKIRFYVKDTGIGMPQEELKNIFERFQQVQQRESNKYGGTGLGLAISKGLVELLGGQMWVESKEGIGSQFYFELPLDHHLSNIESITKMSSPQSLDKLKLLIAEDEEMIQIYFEELLKDTPIQVTFADNGEEALLLYKSNPDYDIILMDIRMPIMGGEEAAKKIWSINPNAKIIAQTAYAMQGDKQRLLEQGFIDYIDKPIIADLLLEKLKTHSPR